MAVKWLRYRQVLTVPYHQCGVRTCNLPGVATPVRKKQMWREGLGGRSVRKEAHLSFSSPVQYSRSWIHLDSFDQHRLNKLFHLLTTLSEKKNFLMSNLLLLFKIFHEWPLVLLSRLHSKNVSRDRLDNPAFNLNTSNRSALLRRSSSDHQPSLCSLSL